LLTHQTLSSRSPTPDDIRAGRLMTTSFRNSPWRVLDPLTSLRENGRCIRSVTSNAGWRSRRRGRERRRHTSLLWRNQSTRRRLARPSDLDAPRRRQRRPPSRGHRSSPCVRRQHFGDSISVVDLKTLKVHDESALEPHRKNCGPRNAAKCCFTTPPVAGGLV